MKGSAASLSTSFNTSCIGSAAVLAGRLLWRQGLSLAALLCLVMWERCGLAWRELSSCCICRNFSRSSLALCCLRWRTAAEAVLRSVVSEGAVGSYNAAATLPEWSAKGNCRVAS